MEPSDPDAGTNSMFAMLTLAVLALVAVGEAKLIRREPVVGTLGLALGVVAVFVGLFLARNALRSEPVDPAYRIRSPQNLESLAETLGAEPTAEAVARAYAPWIRSLDISENVRRLPAEVQGQAVMFLALARLRPARLGDVVALGEAEAALTRGHVQAAARWQGAHGHALKALGYGAGGGLSRIRLGRCNRPMVCHG
jgi:hypothetical protein